MHRFLIELAICGCVAIVFTSTHGGVSVTGAVLDDQANSTNTTTGVPSTTPTTSATVPITNTTTPATTHTTEPVTNSTTGHTTETTTPANMTTTPANITTTSMVNTTTPMSTTGVTTTPIKTTTQSGGNSGSSFDVGSFFGGIALGVGLLVIVVILLRVYMARRSKDYRTLRTM